MIIDTNENYNFSYDTLQGFDLSKSIFYIKEPGSALTHFIGMICSITGALFLLPKAASHHSPLTLAAMCIFIFSMIFLYAASTAYHTFDYPKANTILKKVDHMMIPVLIAGSYTPICLLVLPGQSGIVLLAIVWSIAIIEMLIKLFFVFCPKWVSSVLYIGMGWLCLLKIQTIFQSMGTKAFFWLFLGGVIYTIGGIIYALKLPCFEKLPKNFGNHEIFHLFVMAGSFCHFVVMYVFLI